MQLHLSEDAGYQVTARTTFGKINSDLPLSVSGAIANDSLSGKIGEGGCEMRLTNSNGGIEILRAVKK